MGTSLEITFDEVTNAAKTCEHIISFLEVKIYHYNTMRLMSSHNLCFLISHRFIKDFADENLSIKIRENIKRICQNDYPDFFDEEDGETFAKGYWMPYKNKLVTVTTSKHPNIDYKTSVQLRINVLNKLLLQIKEIKP